MFPPEVQKSCLPCDHVEARAGAGYNLLLCKVTIAAIGARNIEHRRM